MMYEGVLCKQTHENVIRLSPPLVATRNDVDTIVEKLDKVLTKLS